MTPFFCVALLTLLWPAEAIQESTINKEPSCPTDLSIRGGTFSLSDGYRPGSILLYSCPPGNYPYPTRSRVCQSDGKWTPMTSHSGIPTNLAQCRVIRCPPQSAFEHGSFSPRRSSHPVGDILTFECFDGYQLLGSSQRHCLPNGRWNGTAPVCDDGVGHCRSLAIPPGATATGVRNRLGDRVSFQCQNDLNLVGSAQRVCTPEGEWSGAEVSCRAPNLGRRLILSKDTFLYIYLLVDASEIAWVPRHVCIIFLSGLLSAPAVASLGSSPPQIASFDVPVKFSIVSYASQPKTVVDILDEVAEDPELVLEHIEAMRYRDHGNATGTNIHGALEAVYRMMISVQASFPGQWDKIRHAVILFTDGKSNMKGSPKMAVSKIEDFVNVRENRKDYLDIYAFGVGSLDVDWNDLNAITSKKPGETHAFVLKDPQELKEAFENVLDPRDLDDICGLANYSDSARWDQKNPWHVLLKEKHQREPSCRGALVSKTWVLTSAHCFNAVNNTSSWTVILGGGESTVPIKRRIDHALYNVRAKVDQNIKEFYDYDISLLELQTPVRFGGRIRPICLPCTEGANQALKKKSGATTCKDHELELLSFEKVPAQFISLDNRRMNVQIKTKTSRPSCISGAIQEGVPYSQVHDVSEVVTDRFLCSGEDNAVEATTCKGESGGSLFVERRERHFQVGVISWGTYNPCKMKKKDWNTEEIKRDPPPPKHRPRDFYISLFAVQDWLRQHLSGSLRFIPLQ
ncbi:hypothetical protein JRQ81_003537 [Phrynocephalus forsythii]|uniref:Complement C2 n=1 Tax=Phrynocephalus forsythii TaxID=171643 RepID=A0A9Q0XL05_9SAUR|nr:hypothetical protein JRQ81_003537 [Phrynocephalus forsythii]